MATYRKAIEEIAKGAKVADGAGAPPGRIAPSAVRPLDSALAAMASRIDSISRQIPQRIEQGLEVWAASPPSKQILIRAGHGYAMGVKLTLAQDAWMTIPLDTITEPKSWYIMLYGSQRLVISDAVDHSGLLLAKIVAHSEDALRVVDNNEDYEGADPDAFIISGRDLCLATGYTFDDQTIDELSRVLERVDMSSLKGELVTDLTSQIVTASGSVVVDDEGITVNHQNDEVAVKANDNGVAIWTDTGEIVVSARGGTAQINGKFLVNYGGLPSGFIGWFDGTWAQAEALEGWVIADGRAGSPDVVGSQRGIRSVAASQDSGDTGGADTHVHGVTDPGHGHPLTMGAHCHAIFGLTVGGPTSCTSVCLGGGGTDVASSTHTHVANDTPQIGCTASTGDADSNTTDVSINAGSSWHPYLELIPVMRLTATGDSASVLSHSLLRDLDADDHLQYHTDARGDVRYYVRAEADAKYMPFTGGTFVGDVTFSDAYKTIYGDAGKYIQRSAAGVLSYVSDGRHEFTGGPVYVGAGTPGHTITGAGDLYVADRLEVDGLAYFDSDTYIHALYVGEGGGRGGGWFYIADDGGHLVAGYGGGEGFGNRNLICVDYAARGDNYGHSALSANPTFFVHSVTRAASETDEWISFTHNVTNGIIGLGSGELYIGPTANQNIAATLYRMGTSANEYIESGAAGYTDVHAATDVRIYGGLDCTEIIKLPTTSATVGYITINNIRFLHAYGTGNTFVGESAGNFTLSGAQYNMGIGWSALTALTSGDQNVAIGAGAGQRITTGSNNLCLGTNAGTDITGGINNTCIGTSAYDSGTGQAVVAIGIQALYLATSVINTVAIGAYSGHSQVTADSGVFVGWAAGYYETGANKLFIDNATRASEADGRVKALIYGIFDAAVANQSLLVNGILKSSYGAMFGDGGLTNYLSVETDGSQEWLGTATMWDDVNLGAIILERGVSAPDIVNLSSSTIRVPSFDGNVTTEQLSGTIELPHSWKEGSTVTPHVHWMPTTTGAGNAHWQLEYEVIGPGDTAGGGTVITGTAAGGGVAWDERRTDFSAVTMAGKATGTQIAFRIFRDPTDGADTYEADAAMLTVGVHFEMDRPGSRQITTK